MATRRLGPHFPKIFAAAILEEIAFILLVHLPGYLDGLGVTEGSIGLLYAFGGLTGLAFRPLLGRILDHTHRRTVLLYSGVLNAAAILALATTTVWGGWLWALFLVERLMQIVYFTTMLTYVADALPVEHRTQGLALFGLSGLLPIAIGGVVGDLVIDVLGYDALFALSGTSCLSAWLLVWRLPRLPILGNRPRRSFWAAMTQPDLLPLWWLALWFGAGMETLFTFTKTYVEARGLGSAGLFFGVYGSVAAATRIFGGRSYDRTPQRPLVVGALTLYASCLGLLAVSGSVVVFVVAAIAGGLAHGAIFPVMTSQVVARARTSERGSAMAVFTAIFDIALLAAAPGVGVLIDGFDYRVGFGSIGLALFFGMVVYSIWDRRSASVQPSAA